MATTTAALVGMADETPACSSTTPPTRPPPPTTTTESTSSSSVPNWFTPFKERSKRAAAAAAAKNGQGPATKKNQPKQRRLTASQRQAHATQSLVSNDMNLGKPPFGKKAMDAMLHRGQESMVVLVRLFQVEREFAIEVNSIGAA